MWCFLDPKVGRQMLPVWYSSVWLAKIAKYFLAYQIYRSVGLVIAIICLAIPFILSLFVPIPHGLFFSIFKKSLKKDLASVSPGTAIALIDAI